MLTVAAEVAMVVILDYHAVVIAIVHHNIAIQALKNAEAHVHLDLQMDSSLLLTAEEILTAEHAA